MVNLYQLDTNTKNLKKIGEITTPLDQNLLGYHYYSLGIDLDNCNFEPSGKDLLAETIARGSDFDLYVTLNSTIYNCYVSGNLFKGLFSHELLSAKLQIEAQDAELKSNGEKVDTPYLEIPQESVILSKIDSAIYAFDSASLKYGFEFIINELRTESAIITENNYDFSFDSLTLTLMGSDRDYSGLLFADLTYKAFKWNANFISTLEPITLTFNNDFTKNITKFLELIVQYNAIPGYEMEKISETSGRIVLSEEEKDASLLKVYMYNFIEDRWDFISFVTSGITLWAVLGVE